MKPSVPLIVAEKTAADSVIPVILADEIATVVPSDEIYESNTGVS